MLDRVLVSPSWEEHIPLVCVFTLSSDIFDHTPLLIKRGEKDPTLVLIAKVWQENYASKKIIDKWQGRLTRTRQQL
jgi:hypothetical protein